MKLTKLTTAASVLFVLLAASCSKAPSENKMQAPKPQAKEAGPPESAVREYLQGKELRGLAISRLEFDRKPGPSVGSFNVQFKTESEAFEDLALEVDSIAVIEGRRIPWIDLKDIPQFYQVATSKGANYGSLLAEWQIDRWKFDSISFDGEHPAGEPVSKLKANSLVVGSPEAEAYLNKIAGKSK